MKAAIKYKLVGKKIMNQRKLSDIEWGNLDKNLFNKAFKKNFLWVSDDKYEKWEQVDVDDILRTKFKK